MGKPILAVEVSEKTKELWNPILFSYYQERGDIEESLIQGVIDKKIHESEIGWEGAPRTFRDRIMRKTGYGMEAASMTKARKSKREKALPKKDKEKPEKKSDDPFDDICSKLHAKEKKWWEFRHTAYCEDFEFNDSSDHILLQQLLVEELTQKRLALKQIDDEENTSYSKLITESLQRLHNLQTKLGITREQRADELDAMDGNVAVLSVSLDAKLKEISEIEDEYERDEKYFTTLHNQRDAVNILPPQEKIAAILGINDDGSADSIDKKVDIAKEVEKLHRKTIDEPKISEHEENQDTSDED
jgi:hypothetical protein